MKPDNEPASDDRITNGPLFFMRDDNATQLQRVLLSRQKLRELIREARGGFVPDHVAARLRELEPTMLEEEAAEIAELLNGLIETARGRLHEAGIEPENDAKGTVHRLPKRERDYVANVGVLLTCLCDARTYAGDLDDALKCAHEGIGWCRVAQDYRQQALLWRSIASIHLRRHEIAEEEKAFGNALEAARLSKSVEQIVVSLDELCAFLVVHYRLDEAEQVNDEELALIRTQLGEEVRGKYYAGALMNRARILNYRTEYAEGIAHLREALRWVDGAVDPLTRASIMAHLGSVYLRLEHFRESIECQHEVVRLAVAAGSSMTEAWGFFRLAEAHLRLNELDLAEEMLNRAEERASRYNISLVLSIAAKRAQLYVARRCFDEAVALCRHIIHEIGDRSFPDLVIFAHATLGDAEFRRKQYAESETWYREAIALAEKHFPARTPALRVRLAQVLSERGGSEEVAQLLDELALTTSLNLSEKAKALRLRAVLCERNGDLEQALSVERQAFAVERELMERRAEEAMRNARIIAETDLLERDADAQRERRRRLEHELAEAAVTLGERKRLIESVEERLTDALEKADSSGRGSVLPLVREALAEIQSQSRPNDLPLRYLNGVDEDFYRRLREHCSDLTPKQERLCGLLRAGLASKEISTLLGLGAEGLKAQRKRLRKKLGLQSEERLEVVLATI